MLLDAVYTVCSVVIIIFKEIGRSNKNEGRFKCDCVEQIPTRCLTLKLSQNMQDLTQYYFVEMSPQAPFSNKCCFYALFYGYIT